MLFSCSGTIDPGDGLGGGENNGNVDNPGTGNNGGGQLVPKELVVTADKKFVQTFDGDFVTLTVTLGEETLTDGVTFYDADDNEIPVSPDALIGESWEIADMGIEDSVVSEGWLAGNTLSDLMEIYLEKVVGEDVYKYYGRQFPLLIKFLDIHGKLSVQVHPDDEMAAERYDSLGKAEIWYVMDAEPDAKVYMGFNREVSAQEFYDRCHNGTVDEVLNVIYPKKGDAIYVAPGTVHAAEGGLLIAEIQESSDLTFRLYDWGREFDPATARQMHLEEAIDLIDYGKFDEGLYRKGPLWGDEASSEPCKVPEPFWACSTCGCDDEHCTCGCHDHDHHHDQQPGKDASCATVHNIHSLCVTIVL